MMMYNCFKVYYSLNKLRFTCNIKYVCSKFYSSGANKCIKEEVSLDLENRIKKIPIENFRNFSIVAHIDHGKSTLSDRLLELTGVIEAGNNQQVLDRLGVEKEKGITIKAQTCTMFYFDSRTKKDYLLHLIDTPGHIDFRAEVSRSYASCNGALLLIDATQGIQAQTVSNFFLAKKNNLKLIPIINKIDLENANVEKAKEEIVKNFDLKEDECIPVSSKTNLNVEKIIPKIIDSIPHPKCDISKPLRILLIDTEYNLYSGVVMLVYVVDGILKKGMKIFSNCFKKKYEVKELGIIYFNRIKINEAKAGQLCYISIGLKNFNDVELGDTFFEFGKHSMLDPLPGFKKHKPVIFVSAFPCNSLDFNIIDEKIRSLILNDKAITIEKETSNAFGIGWKMGFLGSLHFSVFQERLETEYGSKIIVTDPSVTYKIVYKNEKVSFISTPAKFPDYHDIKKIENVYEPYIIMTITTPLEYLGTVLKLCTEYKSTIKHKEHLNMGQVLLKYEISLSNFLDGFFDKLKGSSKGFASLTYEESGFKKSDLVKMELLINGQVQDPLSKIFHKDNFKFKSSEYIHKFSKFLKSQLFEVVVQARAEGRIISREVVKPRRKDVTQKLHAADISRKKKLLEKQKKGKKKLKENSKLNIAHETFLKFFQKLK